MALGSVDAPPEKSPDRARVKIEQREGVKASVLDEIRQIDRRRSRGSYFGADLASRDGSGCFLLSQ